VGPSGSRLCAGVGEAVASLKADGIICEPRALRVYPEGELAAHLVGIVSEGGVGFTA